MFIKTFRGETLTLATTVGFSQILGAPPGCNAVMVEVPSATKENISLAFTPRVRKAWFYDDSAATYTDLTAALSDRNTSTGSGTSMNEMQTADFLYIGFPLRARGFACDVGNTNSAGTATMSVTYRKSDNTWAAVTNFSDGTLSTRTLAQDGIVTWDLPTDWIVTTVNGSEELFWVRFAVSAALTDTSVSILQLVGMANTTVNSTTTEAEGRDYMLLQSNAQSQPPYVLYFDSTRYGGIEMKSASITSAANINWLYVSGGGY